MILEAGLWLPYTYTCSCMKHTCMPCKHIKRKYLLWKTEQEGALVAI